MRKFIYFLIGLIAIISCEKEIPEIGFRIKSDGFFLEDGDLLPGDKIPEFSHKLSGGIVSFNSKKKSFDFRTGRISIENFLFELPPGTYEVEFRIPEASLYGQKGGSFVASPCSIEVTESMDPEITVNVSSNCALLLVQEEENQLDNGAYMIRRYPSGDDYISSYPLSMDTLSGLYYAYFAPDTTSSFPSAFLWFYDDKPGIESGGLHTSSFEKGYQYLIKVLD